MSSEKDYLRTCDPALNPLVSRRGKPFTPRRAVDSTGCLGSLYDACCDTVLQAPKRSLSETIVKEPLVLACCVESIQGDQSTNLLESINMHHELRLSVALKMTKEMGIGGLINYSYPINKYTRLITYSSLDRTEYLSEEEFQSLGKNMQSMPDTLATHVIVLVNWGIDATVVVQLPTDDNRASDVEKALEFLCLRIKNGYTGENLLQSDKNLLETIRHTEIFSNIPELAKLKSVIEFSDEISRIKKNPEHLKPYNYNLCAIQHLCTTNNQNIFVELKQDVCAMIEKHVIPLLYTFNKVQRKMEYDYSNVRQQLKQQMSDLNAKWSTLKGEYTKEIETIREIVIQIRRGRSTADQKEIERVCDGQVKNKLIKDMNDLDYDMKTLQEKEAIIVEILEKGIEYRAMSNDEIDHNDTSQTIKTKLMADRKYQRIICFNDDLYKSRQKWKNIFELLKKEQQNIPDLKILAVDLTYSSYQLSDFLTFSGTEDKTQADTQRPITARASSARQKTDPHINILLIGETGVGKSTFINAFVNYFTFERLEDAQQDPIVLIPFSFLITTGPTFEEHQVKFGDANTFKNEDFSKTGQSVTQHCKSYIFQLDHRENHEKRKLRIIDTPGIGDVRGTIQDDINMQHILSYINNLPYINAVCILMKPNESRLNIFYRSCFLQLINFLGDSIRDKIIFCFTNSRSTFYAPGDTGPLLKSLIESIPGNKIPFAKKNTFCFDSESFRYLVAKQNRITFTDNEEKNFEASWTKSSVESKRFLNYLRTEMVEPIKTIGNTSAKNAQLHINRIVRPLLETMRNNLRNSVLLEYGSKKTSIQLRPQPIKDSNGICLRCPRPFIKRNDIWILSDALHVFHNNCRTCDCEANEHYSIDYQLQYDLSTPSTRDKLTAERNELCKISAKFAYFLANETDALQDDPFLLGFKRMIREETHICETKTDSALNVNLLKFLKDLMKDYKSIKTEVTDRKKTMRSSDVFEKIQELRENPIIDVQMKAAEEFYKSMMKRSEQEIII